MGASHRRGRRVNLITPPRRRPAPPGDLFAVVNDASKLRAAASSARMIFRTRAGQFELPVSELLDLHPDELEPVRRPASYGAMRNYIGRFGVPTRGDPASVWFESLNELAHLRDMCLGGHVLELATQPMELTWPIGRGHVWHTPDILARTKDGMVLCDVTLLERGKPQEREALCQLTAETVAAAGWRFEVRTELPPQRRVNIGHVHACRHASADQTSRWAERAMTLATWPAPLADVENLVGPDGSGAAAVLHLVGAGALWIDLDLPLSTETLVYTTEPNRVPPPWIKNY